MTQVWFPLLIDTGPSPDFDVNNDLNVVPDWNAGKIYSVSFDEGTVYTHSATTGAFVSKKTVAAICVISSSAYIPLLAIRLGTDGYLYAMGTHGATGADRKANLRLSKIDPSSMTEVAAITPYAVAHPGTYSLDDDWRLEAFRLNGVDYVALLLAGSNPANIEFFNTSLTSLTTYDYSASGAEPFMIVGEQPTATTQKLYLVIEEASGLQDDITLVAVTFNASGPSASDAVLNVLHAADFNPAWVTDPDPDPSSVMFDPADSSLVLRVQGDNAASGQNQTMVAKVETVTGTVAWTVEISPAGIWNNTDADFSQASITGDLSSGTLIIPSPTSTDLYTITLSTGAFTSAPNAHFDGTSYGGVYQSASWNGARDRMLFYYQGSNDLSPAWPSGGWAVWGLNASPSAGMVQIYKMM